MMARRKEAEAFETGSHPDDGNRVAAVERQRGVAVEVRGHGEQCGADGRRLVDGERLRRERRAPRRRARRVLEREHDDHT